jgi:hypothetical protein
MQDCHKKGKVLVSKASVSGPVKKVARAEARVERRNAGVETEREKMQLAKLVLCDARCPSTGRCCTQIYQSLKEHNRHSTHKHQFTKGQNVTKIVSWASRTSRQGLWKQVVDLMHHHVVMAWAHTPAFCKETRVSCIVVPSDIGSPPWVAMSRVILMRFQRFSKASWGLQVSVSWSRLFSKSAAVSWPCCVVRWVMIAGIRTLACPKVSSSRA